MKKTGFTRRALALLLVLVMALQLVPAGVFAAYGDLTVADPGIKPETLNADSSINWPIKIYDYLNDGMLFEFNDSTQTGTFANSGADFTKDTDSPPYGGGAMAPRTEIGEDWTYSGSPTYSGSTEDSPMYFHSQNHGTGYYDAWHAPKDFREPGFLRLSDSTTNNYYHWPIATFSSAKSTAGNARYMVMVYRAWDVSELEISVSNVHNNRTLGETTMPTCQDDEWLYMIVDLKTLLGTRTDVKQVWLRWHTGSTNGMVGSSAMVDFTHVGFFADRNAAENYATSCLEFIADPGEYLHQSTTFQAAATRPNADLNLILSEYYYWQKAGSGATNAASATINGVSHTARYGLDFTGASVGDGAYVNGFDSTTYQNWSQGHTEYFFGYDEAGGYWFPGGVTTTKYTQSNGATYTRLTVGSSHVKLKLADFGKDKDLSNRANFVGKGWGQYVVIVYRPVNVTTSNNKYAFWVNGEYNNAAPSSSNDAKCFPGLLGQAATKSWTSYTDSFAPKTFETGSRSNTTGTDGWRYLYIDINDVLIEGNYDGISKIAREGIYLQAGLSIDIAAVAFFGSMGSTSWAERIVNYMTAEPTQGDGVVDISWGSSRHWNTGNNKGFGLLRATGGGNWQYSGGSGGTNTTDEYGYRTWYIGYNTAAASGNEVNTSRRDPMNPNTSYTANYTDASGNLTPNATGTSNYIYHFNTYNTGKMETDVLQFDGYDLLQTIASKGVMTAGLLEGSIRTIAVDGTRYRVPVYRQETVEYIAYLLAHALVIPQRDGNGNYNSNYIDGGKSSLFAMDLNGDGQLTMINLDGDSRSGTYTGNTCDGKETDENYLTLAQALRGCLGISLPVGKDVGTYKNQATQGRDAAYTATLGTYAATLQKDTALIGNFQDVKGNIETAMDAAYFLLNSIFVGNSYNQAQDTYYYLNMPSAEVTSTGSGHEGKLAYVFDGGFSTHVDGAAIGSTITAANAANNKNGIVYDEATGTIKLHPEADGKVLFSYDNSSSQTTRFPFLPVTDAEGDFAGGTTPVNRFDTDVRTYTTGSNGFFQTNEDGTNSRRNYNFAMVSNGEFVFNQEDGLFFEFEGDDDVYLFINGELVMDIGGGHGITGVYFDVNDYVLRARTEMASLAGYSNEMGISEADELIEQKLEAGEITAAQAANYKRYCRLDLVDGQICQFDFYYMERHSWGSNMRIVTNMHITDPSLNVDKTAHQFGEQIEYGGVIDPTAAVEYNFSLTNAGNTKLYNLTFKDDVIGVTLDPNQGLVVGQYTPADGGTPTNLNGIYVLDAGGGKLEPKDLTAVLTGEDAEGKATYLEITFPEAVDENGVSDGGQQALKNFLTLLDAEGTEKGDVNAENTHAGAGLWVDATVTFKGIYYMLTPDQIKAQTVTNIVNVSATTRSDPSIVGNRTLTSADEHRIYTTGFPIHFQWADHSIFMSMSKVLTEAIEEANKPDSQLSLYQQFFKNNTDITKITSVLCNRYGRVQPDNNDIQKATSNVQGAPGFFINFDEPGIHTFYILMYKNTYSNVTYAPTDINDGDYAILRSQVYVADVEDSVYVLDYGLSTETLDVGGELFKNDYLFGTNGTVQAKLMGVTGSEPSFVRPEDYLGTANTGAPMSSITFKPIDLEAGNVISTNDGRFKVNLAIPSTGKEIAYDAINKEYTLTGVGTSKVIVDLTNVLSTWTGTPYLYYWHDDGTPGPAFPGTQMTSVGNNKYELEIPANAANLNFNNGSSAVQTRDLHITPGVETTFTILNETITENGKNCYEASKETVVQDTTLHVKAPSDWTNIKVEYQESNGTWTEAPINGLEDRGYVPYNMIGTITRARITNVDTGTVVETNFYEGKRVWVEILADDTNDVGYTTKVRYTLDTYVIHASVPNSWGEDIYLYSWHSGQGSDMGTWPGVKMTKGEFGWYTFEGVPADVTNAIINNGGTTQTGGKQTIDLVVTPGLETWITVSENTVLDDGTQKHTAGIAYGSEDDVPGLTFTPNKFMDEGNSLWLALTVHSASAVPTKLVSSESGAQTIDIHDEVQMYKKITVLPANVVYYEDDFADIDYTTVNNSFEFFGDGSGRLTQGVDQSQIYGHDPAYQDASNNVYSGNSLTKIKINTKDTLASFTFTGTGFEIVSRTDAENAGSMKVKIFKDGVLQETLGVITEFDQGNDGGSESIDQTPVIRKTGLTFGTYTVEISGMPKNIYCRGAVSQTGYTAPTCSTSGVATYACSGCDKTWTETIPADISLHSYDNWDEDYNDYRCSGCGALQYCEHNALYGDPSTCVNPGNGYCTLYSCSMWVKLNAIAPLGHDYAGGSSCSRCGEERVPDNHFAIIGTEESYLYIDGIRIYQPMGTTHDSYLKVEKGAAFYELRDLIASGKVAVATLNAGQISVSTGTTTWTESLMNDEFSSGDSSTYVATQVGSTDDYLIQGPNNEVYMEGTVINSALAFYVKADTSTRVHELQIAARALNYAGFYGAGFSELNVQLQYGVIDEDGNYAWKNLAKIVSGTEQYYTVPYAECPTNDTGYYQVVIRAVNAEDETPALVSYTNVKLNGLTIEKVEGVGYASILKYVNGVMLRPTYYLLGTINGVTYTQEMIDADPQQYKHLRFDEDGILNITLDAPISGLALYRDMGDQDFLNTFGSYDSYTAAGEVTFFLTRVEDATENLDWCVHKWDEGVVTREPNCATPGIKIYTCNELTVDGQHNGVTRCGCTKTEVIPTNGEHQFSGGVCVNCREKEPAFYLVGYINGANYGCEEDYMNLGEYLFVDGKLSVTFDDSSYIFLKSGDNSKWYLAENYIGDGTTTGDFYHDKSYGQKMFVPAGVEVNFTLVQKDDGGLNLSYTVTCRHEWDSGVVIEASTCVKHGTKLYTCTKSDCGLTKEEALPLAEHTYGEFDICTVCQAKDPTKYHTVYFFNSKAFATPYIYTWTKNAEGADVFPNGEWPGQVMTPVAGSPGVYSASVHNDLVNVQFGDGSTNPDNKADTTIPADKNMFTFTGRVWNTFGEEQSYALFGHINGADYATWNEDSQYKFTWDAEMNAYTLKVTFEKDSYVAVKTQNSAYWYMPKTYIQSSSGLMYLTSENAGEKMFVPGATELVFTLKVHEDEGTVELSYAAACEHSWGTGTVTTEPGCTTTGIMTFTCSNCQATKTEVIASKGHTFVDGVCSVCGTSEDASKKVIYFVNTANWTQPAVWAWNDSQNFTGGNWPGWEMVPVEGNLWQITIDKQATWIIFNNNNNGVQTGNLPFPTGEENMFTWDGTGEAKGTWSVYDPTASSASPAALTVEEEITDSNAAVNVSINEDGTVNETVTASGTGLKDYAMNLVSIQNQLASNRVIGDSDISEIDPSLPGGDVEPETPVTAPVIKPQGASLSFKDEIYYNVLFNIENPGNVEIVETGLITWTSQVDGTVDNAEFRTTELGSYDEYLKLRTQAISAKNMAEKLYFKIYLKLADGTYVYSNLLDYSAKTYCDNKLADANASDELKALCVSLMNYGASAQTFFGYKTDALMNADLTADQQALVREYAAGMIAGVVTSTKSGSLIANGGFSSMYPSVTFGGAFSINYTFAPTNTVEGDMKLYVWTAEDYANVDELTLDNASQVIAMTGTNTGAYTGRFGGISAKNVGDTVYVCGVYESSGTTYYTGVLAYSVGAYCDNMANRVCSVQDLAAATGVYAYYAKAYFLGN